MILERHTRQVERATHTLLNQPQTAGTILAILADVYALGVQAGLGQMSEATSLTEMLTKLDPNLAQRLYGHN